MCRSKGTLISTFLDYKGRRISLYKQEEVHIFSMHMDEMGDNMHVIPETLSSPDAVYQSATSQAREVFVKGCSSASYSSQLPFTRVVVEVYENGAGNEGHVVTAFPSKKEKGGNDGEAIYRKEDV